MAILSVVIVLSRPRSDADPPVLSTHKRSAPASREPVTAVALFAAYAADESRADTLFRGRSLKVVGTVVSVNREVENRATALLSGGAHFASVYLTFLDPSEPELNELQPDRLVTVYCTGDGLVVEIPALTDCSMKP